jgi:hypothetical protein
MRLHSLALMLTAACSSPEMPTELEPCGPNGTCPETFECEASANRCYLIGSVTGAFLWFKMNDPGSATALRDSSSYGMDGAVTGAVTLADGKATFGPGASAATQPLEASYRDKPISVSGWATPRERSDRSLNQHSITPFPPNAVSNDIPGRFGYGFGINVWTDAGGGSELIVGGAYTAKVSALTFVAGRRYHVVVAYSEAATKVYLDGSLVATLPAYPLSAGSAPVYVGRHNDDAAYGSKRFFVGDLDDVRVYQRLLTDADAAALYAAGPE